MLAKFVLDDGNEGEMLINCVRSSVVDIKHIR